MSDIINLLEYIQKTGISSALILCGIASLCAIAGIFYHLVYKRDQDEHRNNFIKVVESLEAHITSEESKFGALSVALEKLSTAITEINITLVKDHITRADIDRDQWSIVKARIDETAEVVFSGAMMNACLTCEQDCNYLIEFSKLIQTRRKESWHIWEQSAIPRSILTIIEQVDEELYPKVVEQYIPDITSICKNKDYSKFSKEVRVELIKSKVDVYKEKVKRDWETAILRRVNML